MTSEPMLDVAGVWAAYGKKPVLLGVSLSVAAGEIVALLGHNGAGKSTLLKTVMGLLQARSGDVLYRQRSITGRSVAQNIADGISYVCQGRNVFPDLTVRENLEIGLPSGRHDAASASRQADVYRLFPRLAERARQRAGLLSGGEQQMVALGRALMNKPSLLLLDEPSLGLSPGAVVQLFSVIQRIAREWRVAVLMVEQKTAQALEVADRGYIMRGGQVSLEGPASDLKQNTTWWHLF